MDQCLANYLGTTRQNLPELFAGAAMIAQYPAQIRATLEQRSESPIATLVSGEVDRAENALAWSGALQGDVERFRSHYAAGTLRMLEAWSGELNHRHSAHPAAVTDQLAAVREGLD